MQFFDYGRASGEVTDRSGALTDRVALETFATQAPNAGVLNPLERALADNGTLPVKRPFLGLGGAALLLMIIAVVTGSVSAGLCLAGHLMSGFFVGIITVFSLIGAPISQSKYKDTLMRFKGAWDNGWVEFGPAKVGAVWIQHVSHHSGTRPADQESRYQFQARVQACSWDGTPLFEFDSEPFPAPSDKNGVPVGLNTAPTPLDLMEPESFNGWTVARWYRGMEESSATIATGLDKKQIIAALNQVGIR